MSQKTIKPQEAVIFILYILAFLNLTPECVAELIIKKDMADVLPNAFTRKTEPFSHFLGYTTDGGYLMVVVFLTTEVVPDESWGYQYQIYAKQYMLP